MELKNYQKRVLSEVQDYLQALEAAKKKGESAPSYAAWLKVGGHTLFFGRQNGLGKDLPTFCIKVPTGGGKTLLATRILGTIYQTILKERRGTGLVLWVVPSDQIYKDTLRRLRDRADFYNESLRHALSQRIEIWEKHEIARITPSQIATCLNILVIKLQGTNRQDKETLKFFRDSGGNIISHFPPEDEPEKHKKLKKQFSDLDMLEDDEQRGAHLVKTSLANLVRVNEPAVILDEGHKWTSKLARKTVESFNPRIVVELSATPPKGEANVLVEVSGKELLNEHMIKLPLNVANNNVTSWKDVLTAARDKRQELSKTALKHYHSTGYLIRPIVLVQVERTGKDQLDTKFIHSEQVKEYLIQHLGVTERAVAIKTSEKDDIEGIDLMDENCPVEWIITKQALQEGWDCPFAYILVSLARTGSTKSMTQLVGRVLRQPRQRRTEFDELNQSYVFCLRRKAKEVSAEVKSALEKEGYEGDLESVVDRSGEGGKPAPRRQVKIRDFYLRFYKKPFQGRIFLPRFCVKEDREITALDYYRHLLAKMKVEKFDYEKIDWDLSEDLKQSKAYFWQISIGEETEQKALELQGLLEDDEAVKSWLVANLDFSWFSAKQIRVVVEGVCDRLKKWQGQLNLLKFPLRERIDGFIRRNTDEITEQLFKKMHKAGEICFYLECVEGRFEIPRCLDIDAPRRLNHDDGEPVERSLFDWVADNMNEYERSVALALDRNAKVLWWYRNVVGQNQFAIQGYRRNPIYPDFVVQKGNKTKEPIPEVLVVESKGGQLKGNEDTNYKRDLARLFEEVGKKVSWQELGEGFRDRKFRFQILDEGEYQDDDWHDDLKKILER
ncbi:MAG: DEAD/DEAH box helicase family protein [Verrucomicrobia bacterium]|nr:DEAD/DEAH box helicase family protein [Verrucomicrobiota bacterium]